jgi:hypothetical protein
MKKEYLTDAHIEALEAKIQELDALNSDLTDLYNKHMAGWAGREKVKDDRIKSLEECLIECFGLAMAIKKGARW